MRILAIYCAILVIAYWLDQTYNYGTYGRAAADIASQIFGHFN